MLWCQASYLFIHFSSKSQAKALTLRLETLELYVHPNSELGRNVWAVNFSQGQYVRCTFEYHVWALRRSEGTSSMDNIYTDVEAYEAPRYNVHSVRHFVVVKMWFCSDTTLYIAYRVDLYIEYQWTKNCYSHYTTITRQCLIGLQIQLMKVYILLVDPATYKSTAAYLTLPT